MSWRTHSTTGRARWTAAACASLLAAMAIGTLAAARNEPVRLVGEVLEAGPEVLLVRLEGDDHPTELVAGPDAPARRQLLEVHPGLVVEMVAEHRGDGWLLLEVWAIGDRGRPPHDERGDPHSRHPPPPREELERRRWDVEPQHGQDPIAAEVPEPRSGGPGEPLTREWQLEPGWTVTRPPDAPLRLHGTRHAWARRVGGSWDDLVLELRLRLDRGTLHVCFRVSGASRYFVGLSSNGVYLSKQTGPETFFEGLAHSEAGVPRGRPVQIRIAATGDRVEVWVEGQRRLEYEDRTPLAGGTVALESLDGTEVWVDSVTVAGSTGGDHPAQRPVVADVAVRPLEVIPVTERGPVAIPALPAATRPELAGIRPAVEARDPATRWVRTGGPPGGLGYDIRVDPRDPRVMYVTDAWAGVFKSTDGGRSWLPSNGTPDHQITVRKGLTGEAIPVFCLTIDPHDSSTLWAGTQHQLGIFKSTDAGRTWARKDASIQPGRSGFTLRGFTVDPQDRNVVYAAAEVSSHVWAGHLVRGKEFDCTRGVVYRTTDGGTTWRSIWTGDNLARYIWVHPQDSSILYVSTGIFDREAANSKPKKNIAGGVGVVKSTDGGTTWRQVNAGLGNLYVGSLFMRPKHPDTLLAGVGCNPYRDGSGVYLTTDGGASWTQTLGGDTINSVEYSVSEPSIAYAGSEHRIYRSSDGGVNWKQVTPAAWGWGAPGFKAGFPIDFQIPPGSPDRLWANNYGGGNFLTTDGGRTWTDASHGYTGAQIRGVAVDPTHPDRVLAAGRGGLFISSDRGVHWSGCSYPLALVHDADGLAVDPAHPQRILAASSAFGTLHLSGDGGRSWQQVAPQPATKTSWRSIAFAPSGPGIVYAGSAGYTNVGLFDNTVAGRGVFRSEDGGTTWKPANSGPCQQAHVATVAVNPREPAKVWAATTNAGLLRSTDHGNTWQRVGPKALQQGVVLSVAVSPSRPELVHAGLDGGGVYVSFDGGSTWHPKTRGLPAQAKVAEIVVHPGNPDRVFLADLISGVYVYDSIEQQWVGLTAGLDLREVNALALAGDGSTLYAGTEGAGVFRIQLERP